MKEINELHIQTDWYSDRMAQLNPHLDEEGTPVDMALALTSKPTAMQAKKDMAMVRNEAAKARLDLELKQKALKRITEEQSLILRGKIDKLQALVSTAEEAIWTVNLYLGTEEEIVRLAEGEPTPADEPITVRQLVLYMDEECAIASESGGIDHSSIDSFDEWLLEDPRHLQQVFPEPKGVVAIKPRRHKKEYGDPWINATRNAENQQTYFLLRNSGNLYRMLTNFNVPDRLVPRTDEFTSFFRRKHYNHQTHEYEEVAYKPGSWEFMEAEKKADTRKRHYMRVALILQGLIDRTTIFHPLPGPIDVSRIETYEHDIRVVLDADLMLTDGWERFTTWIRRINKRLEPGMRIIGSFSNYEHGLWQHRQEKWGGNSRLSPKNSAYPDSSVLYTIAGRRGSMLFFLYSRAGEWREYKNRATCLIDPQDEFVLNFDAATISEMQFYLQSRLDREQYTYLFPLLKTAIKLKQEEEATEASFRKLLTGDLMRLHNISLEEAEFSVDKLVSWWKFKNRTHRALTSDDAKAHRMILREYRSRQDRSTERARLGHHLQEVTDKILLAERDAVLIAHKTGKEFAALIAANDECVFVHEQSWVADGKGVELVRTSSWVVVDNRYQKWEILYAIPRWAIWERGANILEHLTDPEVGKLVNEALAWCKDQKNGCIPLAAVLEGNRIVLYYQHLHLYIPPGILTGKAVEPSMHRAEFGWKKTKNKAALSQWPSTHHLGIGSNTHPWEGVADGRVMWTSEKEKAFDEEYSRWIEYRKKSTQLREKTSKIFEAVKKIFIENEEKMAYDKFLQEFGDPDLWEGHKKTLKTQAMPTEDLWQILAVMVENDKPVVGKTLTEITAEASDITDKKLELPEELAEYVV